MIIAQGQITISAVYDGDDGVSIVSVDAEYCQSISNTQLINPDWSTQDPEWETTPPTYESGKYIWTRTVITYSDTNTDTTDPVCISGQDGQDGRGIVSVQEQYGKSSDRGTEPSSWVNSYADLGTLTDNDYVWTRNYITYTTGNPTVTDAVCVTGAKGDLADPPFNVILGNEFQAIPCNTSGNVKTNLNVTIPFSGYKGLTKIATSVTVPPVLGTGISLYNKTDSQDGGDGSIVLSFAGGSDLGGTIIGVVTFTFTLGDVSIPKSFTWMKVDEGDGSTIALYELSANTPYLNGTVTNTITPTTVTFNAVSKANAQATGSAYQGRFVITEVPTNGPTSNKYVSSVDESSVTYTLSTNTNLAAVKCSLYLSGGLIAKIDEVTVPVIFATALESKLVEITTSVSGVRTDVDAANQSITDEVWKNDVYTVLDKDGNTVNVSMANLLVQHSQDIRGINQTASRTASDLESLETDVSTMSLDYSGFKTEVSSTYQTKADTQANYALKTEVTQTASTLDTKISNEIENRETLIRAFEGGTLTCRIGQDYGVWTDADGAVKIVTVTWDEDDEPTIDEVVSSFGPEAQIGKDGQWRVLITDTDVQIINENDDVVSVFSDSVTVGQDGDTHILLLPRSLQVVDSVSPFFNIRDLRDANTGLATLSERYILTDDDVSHKRVILNAYISNNGAGVISAKLNNATLVLGTDYAVANEPRAIDFNPQTVTLHTGDIFEIVYTSSDDTLKSYTLGYRSTGVSDGVLSLAHGNDVTATGQYSFASGYKVSAIGNGAHAEGYGAGNNILIASGTGAHAEGYATNASGSHSHAEGSESVASGESAHAEGADTTASGAYSHSEGNRARATMTEAHAEGYNTLASGEVSHAEGGNTRASGLCSHSQNEGTIAAKRGQTAIGTYNIEDTSNNNRGESHEPDTDYYGQYALIIGNGTSAIRSNALTVGWDGELSLALDATAASGTVDYMLYNAILATGWTGVIT